MIHTACADLPVSNLLKENLKNVGYERLTQIQDESLKPILNGSDIVGIAQTGTGKTAAFLIPIITNLLGVNSHRKALIVLPTRELALQVEGEIKKLTKGMSMNSAVVVGGTNLNNDLKSMGRDNHFVVGTPGRLLDLLSRKALHLNQFEVLVLDEFDRLLDMGFLKGIQRITSGMVNRKQTILFSATEDPRQKKIIDPMLKNPVYVRVHPNQQIGEQIEQKFIHVGESDNKFQMLKDLINQEHFQKVLVFAETKRGISRLCKRLKNNGILVDQIHGDRSQSQRVKALNAFASGKIKVLLATDVASRGLDISEVSQVINYQIPRTTDSYVHRIGRTGRAGCSGTAYTFIES